LRGALSHERPQLARNLRAARACLTGHDPTVATGRYGGSQSHLLVAAACIVIVGVLTA